MVFIGVIGFGIGAIWWASSIQTKIDVLLDDVRASRALVEQVNKHETRIQLLESRK